MTPKDFYFVQILKNEEVSDGELSMQLIRRLLLDEEDLESFTVRETRKIFEWAGTNLLESKIMPVENWLQTAYHLSKERWGESIDWLEKQPVPKILLMIDIVNSHVKAQEAEMKKSRKR
jgi:hypothetical protein